MSLSTFTRQAHRWISIAFVATVIANFIALGFGQTIMVLTYLPLLPLFLLMASGLYLFVLPYAARRRAWREA